MSLQLRSLEVIRESLIDYIRESLGELPLKYFLKQLAKSSHLLLIVVFTRVKPPFYGRALGGWAVEATRAKKRAGA